MKEREQVPRHDIQGVETEFIDFLEHRRTWGSLTETEVPPIKRVLLRKLLCGAGFDVEYVNVGECSVPGSFLGTSERSVRINPDFCFRAVDPQLRSLHFPTGWLNAVASETFTLLRKHNRQVAIGRLLQRIREIDSFRAIRLTHDGHFLIDVPPVPKSGDEPFFIKRTHEASPLPIGTSVAGVHLRCGGAMHRFHQTSSFDAIVCSQCYLRVEIPLGIETYEALRAQLCGE